MGEIKLSGCQTALLYRHPTRVSRGSKGNAYFDYTDEELSEEFGAAGEYEREQIPA